MDSDSDRFVNKLQRYKRRRGVFEAAQALRRQGLSLKAALLLSHVDTTVSVSG